MIDVADFTLGRGSAPVAGDVSFNDALGRTAEVGELQMECDRLVAQLCSVTLEGDSCRSLARDWDDDTMNPQASLDTSKYEHERLEGQNTVSQKEKEAVAFERETCNTKAGRVQVLFRRCRDACNHIAKSLNDEGVRSEGGRPGAANNAEEEMIHFLCGRDFSMRDFVGKHIARAQASVTEYSSTVLRTLHSVETSCTISHPVNPSLMIVRSTSEVLFRFVAYFCFFRSMLRPMEVLRSYRRLMGFNLRARFVRKGIARLHLGVRLGILRYPGCGLGPILLRSPQKACLLLT